MHVLDVPAESSGFRTQGLACRELGVQDLGFSLQRAQGSGLRV